MPESEVLGTYYQGDGLGDNEHLTIGPGHRFNFRWTGCLGEYDRNSGSWTVEGDVIVLHPEKPNRREGFEGTNVRLIPMKWGQRMYLIDENEAPGFAANAGKDISTTLDSIHGSDYVKLGADHTPGQRKGKPQLPQRFKTFYDEGPIEAMVSKVQGDGIVELRCADSERLYPGLLLCLKGFGSIDLEILSTSASKTVARSRYFFNSDKEVKVGDMFTSGQGWDRPRGTGFRPFFRFVDVPKG